MATTNTEPKVTCDLCKSVIDVTKPWPQMVYPFADSERERLAKAICDRYPAPFGNIIGIVRSIPPVKYHKLDFCQGCVDGFMPMLEELRGIAYQAQLHEFEGKVKERLDADAEFTGND
jgi:hypothetical protein